LWDKRFGGIEEDLLIATLQINENEYLLAGNSYSDKSSDKTENNREEGPSNSSDFWIIKLR
jgi:hypothetical protein